MAVRRLHAADLRVGMDLGAVSVDPGALMRDWAAANPDVPVGAALPPGFLVAVLMRGCLALTEGRPPGNIHAGLDLAFGAPARPDRPVDVAVSVAGKTERKGRPWISFAVACRQDGETVLSATSDVVWAA